jgi:hypothetical protein
MTYKKRIDKSNGITVFITKYNDEGEQIASAFFSERNYNLSDIDIYKSTPEDLLTFFDTKGQYLPINYARALIEDTGIREKETRAYIITKDQEKKMSFDDEMLIGDILNFFGNCGRDRILRDAFTDYHRSNKCASSNDGMQMAIIGVHLLFEQYSGKENSLFSKKKTPEKYFKMKYNFYEMLDRIKKHS